MIVSYETEQEQKTVSDYYINKFGLAIAHNFEDCRRWHVNHPQNINYDFFTFESIVQNNVVCGSCGRKLYVKDFIFISAKYTPEQYVNKKKWIFFNEKVLKTKATWTIRHLDGKDSIKENNKKSKIIIKEENRLDGIE